MTFERLDLSLESKCYVVQGINEDDKGQLSNGSGKTSLLDIISVCLTGESLSGRDLKKCVNRLSPDSFFTVSLTLQSSVKTIISRKVYNNTRSAELSITVDGKLPQGVVTKQGVENGIDVKDGNKYILENILGISKADLLNYFLISGEQYQSFFSVNNTKKMEIISRFSKAGKIDQVIENLSSNLKQTNSSLSSLQLKLSNLQGKKESLGQLINEEAVQRFGQEKENRINKLVREIEDLDKQINEVPFHKSIPSLTNIDVSILSLQEAIVEVRDIEKNVLEEKQKVDKHIRSLEVKLIGEIECPKCQHKFSPKERHLDLSELKNSLDEFKSQLPSLDQEIDLIVSEHQKLKNELSELQSQQKEVETKIHQNTLSEQKQNNLRELIEQKVKQIETEVSLYFDDNGVKRKIEKIDEELNDTNILIESSFSSIKTTELWIDRFKQFKFYLSNKPVEIICHYTNQFLKQLNSDLSISIEGFKVLKSGELRAELTPIIYRSGLNPEPYSSFSGGERVRLNLACDLALQRLINENSGAGLDFLCTDEAINALDSLGIANAAKAFNSLNKTILLVTHSGSELNYDNIITVRKKNNKSEII